MSSTNRSRNDAWTKNHVPRDAAVALKRNIGVSLNFVDSLEGDGTNTWRKVHHEKMPYQKQKVHHEKMPTRSGRCIMKAAQLEIDAE